MENEHLFILTSFLKGKRALELIVARKKGKGILKTLMKYFIKLNSEKACSEVLHLCSTILILRTNQAVLTVFTAACGEC